MRTIAAILFFLLASSLFSQAKRDRVTYSFEDEKLETILDSLSQLSTFQFSYNPKIIPQGSLFSFSALEMPIDEFLSSVLVGTGLSYSFFKDQIIIKYQDPELTAAKPTSFSLSGKVLDEHGTPIPNVNIFLDGTTIGVSSDKDGRYRLEDIPVGRYQLVFSYIGYMNGIYSIEERNGDARIQNHTLEVDQQQLDEVQVVGKKPSTDKQWAESYAIFKSELLGPTEHGSQCTIENPEVLSFRFDNDANETRAFASAPIEIRNNALGYRILYFLESFEKSPGNLRYRGKLKFIDLVPETGREARNWKKNREESFHGSLNHFKQALLRDEIRNAGFRMYQVTNLRDFQRGKYKKVRREDILVFKGAHYLLDFKNFLLVEFRKERESERFLSESEFAQVIYSDLAVSGSVIKTPEDQLSAIQLLHGPVRLDLSGEIMDRFGITIYGYWSWERIGDLVPINYNPKTDNF